MTRQHVVQRLARFIADKLVKDPNLELDESEPVITGGLIDSFCLAHIAVFIETEFGVLIPDDDLTVDNMDTLGQMADRVCRDPRGED